MYGVGVRRERLKWHRLLFPELNLLEKSILLHCWSVSLMPLRNWQSWVGGIQFEKENNKDYQATETIFCPRVNLDFMMDQNGNVGGGGVILHIVMVMVIGEVVVMEGCDTDSSSSDRDGDGSDGISYSFSNDNLCCFEISEFKLQLLKCIPF